MKIGFLFRYWSFWVGAHYSKYNKRWCINIFPMCTIWIVEPGGNPPKIERL